MVREGTNDTAVQCDRRRHWAVQGDPVGERDLSEEDRRTIYDPSRPANRRLADQGTDERAWFADEVAIDFPSVDGILGADA